MGWNFARELASRGPESTASLAEARAYCRHVARTHYENFTAVSLLLPRRLVPHFEAVYAWCRWADDLADETDQSQSLALLDWWERELQACYDGTPRHAVAVALQPTVREFAIPRQLFHDLLSAFRQDQVKHDYESFDQLADYCRRSANPVGRIVLHLFRACDDERSALADEICTGLQLANFWQDVARDHARGRIYLPREDRVRFGYSATDLAARRANDAFLQLMRFEVERTRGYFDRGRALVPLLPPRPRFAVALFISGGVAVLDAIAGQGFDVWHSRPVISKKQKGLLMLQALPRLLTKT